MRRAIKPEILLVAGFISLKAVPLIFSNVILKGLIVFTAILILLIGAVGIARRNRTSLTIFLFGFSMLFVAFFFDKILHNTSFSWGTIGTTGSFLIWGAVISSWVVSLVKKSSKNRRS